MGPRPRTTRLQAAAAGALLIVVTAACTTTQAAPTPSVTAIASTSPRVAADGTASATSAAAATMPTPINGGDQVVACAAADIRPEIIAQADRTSGTTRMALLQLTNISSRTCGLAGWASVTLMNAANEPVQVPTSSVPEPGDATQFDLPPGTTASAGIKWTTCDKAAGHCPTGNGLSVGLPKNNATVAAELSEFPAAERSAITMTSLQIGTIQPSHQGAVAW